MHECQVWWASPNDVAPWHAELLSPAERARAGTYHRDVDRARSIVGAALLRLVAGPMLGRDPSTVPVSRHCPVCGGPHGRPVIAGSPLHLSVSHSGGRVVVAVTAAGPVGVDVEAVGRLDLAELASVLAVEEVAEDVIGFLTYWCRKESAVKATGDGLRVPLSTVVVSGPTEPPRLIAFRPEVIAVATMYDLHPGADHLAALTVLSPEPVAVTEHDATALLASPRRPAPPPPLGPPAS